MSRNQRGQRGDHRGKGQVIEATANVTVGNQSYSTPYGINHSSSSADNEGTILPSVTTDINGLNRPYGGTHDIGAFEDH